MSQQAAAILGASTNRAKFGNKSVRAHARAGYIVYPINPRAEEIEGHPCYPSLAQAPRPIHRISLYLPPALGLQHWDEIAEAAPEEVWLNPGTDTKEMIAKGRERGLNVIVGCSIVDLGFSPSQFPS